MARKRGPASSPAELYITQKRLLAARGEGDRACQWRGTREENTGPTEWLREETASALLVGGQSGVHSLSGAGSALMSG